MSSLTYRFMIKHGFPYLIKLQKKLYHLLRNLYYLALNEEDFIQFFLYWIFSFLGTFVKNYFFSLHLFDLFSRLSLLKNVFQAISYNAKQLFVVAMLGVLFVFVFSFTSFDTYVDDIYQEENPDQTCTTLIQCMITLTTSGVIGTSMYHLTTIY
jgi:inositol 1,4,5-triphosphate receptor type 1/inositol 1,4,5-triphosphate receptor type 3